MRYRYIHTRPPRLFEKTARFLVKDDACDVTRRVWKANALDIAVLLLHLFAIYGCYPTSSVVLTYESVHVWHPHTIIRHIQLKSILWAEYSRVCTVRKKNKGQPHWGDRRYIIELSTNVPSNHISSHLICVSEMPFHSWSSRNWLCVQHSCYPSAYLYLTVPCSPC